MGNINETQNSENPGRNPPRSSSGRRAAPERQESQESDQDVASNTDFVPDDTPKYVEGKLNPEWFNKNTRNFQPSVLTHEGLTAKTIIAVMLSGILFILFGGLPGFIVGILGILFANPLIRTFRATASVITEARSMVKTLSSPFIWVELVRYSMRVTWINFCETDALQACYEQLVAYDNFLASIVIYEVMDERDANESLHKFAETKLGRLNGEQRRRFFRLDRERRDKKSWYWYLLHSMAPRYFVAAVITFLIMFVAWLIKKKHRWFRGAIGRKVESRLRKSTWLERVLSLFVMCGALISLVTNFGEVVEMMRIFMTWMNFAKYLKKKNHKFKNCGPDNECCDWQDYQGILGRVLGCDCKCHEEAGPPPKFERKGSDKTEAVKNLLRKKRKKVISDDIRLEHDEAWTYFADTDEYDDLNLINHFFSEFEKFIPPFTEDPLKGLGVSLSERTEWYRRGIVVAVYNLAQENPEHFITTTVGEAYAKSAVDKRPQSGIEIIAILCLAFSVASSIILTGCTIYGLVKLFVAIMTVCGRAGKNATKVSRSEAVLEAKEEARFLLKDVKNKKDFKKAVGKMNDRLNDLKEIMKKHDNPRFLKEVEKLQSKFNKRVQAVLKPGKTIKVVDEEVPDDVTSVKEPKKVEKTLEQVVREIKEEYPEKSHTYRPADDNQAYGRKGGKKYGKGKNKGRARAHAPKKASFDPAQYEKGDFVLGDRDYQQWMRVKSQLRSCGNKEVFDEVKKNATKRLDAMVKSFDQARAGTSAKKMYQRDKILLETLSNAKFKNGQVTYTDSEDPGFTKVVSRKSVYNDAKKKWADYSSGEDDDFYDNVEPFEEMAVESNLAKAISSLSSSTQAPSKEVKPKKKEQPTPAKTEAVWTSMVKQRSCWICKGKHSYQACPKNPDKRWQFALGAKSEQTDHVIVIKGYGVLYDTKHMYWDEHSKCVVKQESALPHNPPLSIEKALGKMMPICLESVVPGFEPSFVGTAWRCGNKVITAKHCVIGKMVTDQDGDSYDEIKQDPKDAKLNEWLGDYDIAVLNYDEKFHLDASKLRQPIEGEKVHVLGFIEGKLALGTGRIRLKGNFECEHDAPTDDGMSGGPIFSENFTHVLGIHQGTFNTRGQNYGKYFGDALIDALRTCKVPLN